MSKIHIKKCGITLGLMVLCMVLVIRCDKAERDVDWEKLKNAPSFQAKLGENTLAAGRHHSLAIGVKGYVWAWGGNMWGNLGDGTEETRLTPVRVKGVNGNQYLKDVEAIAAGDTHSMALMKDGTVYAWGDNASGQLGIGSKKEEVYRPKPVKGVNGKGKLRNIKTIAGGGSMSAAVHEDGFVYVWGMFGYGFARGIRTTEELPVPGYLVGENGEGKLGAVKKISLGGTHGLALREEGTVWTWGKDQCRQIPGEEEKFRKHPIPIKRANGELFQNIIDICAASCHSLALHENGTVYSWGLNSLGVLGSGDTKQRDDLVNVRGPENQERLQNIVDMACGNGFNVVITSAGDVFSWGEEGLGFLGDGGGSIRTRPVQVLGVRGKGKLRNVVYVESGNGHTLAIHKDGTISAWGDNGLGQLGIGVIGAKERSSKRWRDVPFKVILLDKNQGEK